MFGFFILRRSSYFLIALQKRSVMSELAILLARVWSISKFSTILLKCLLIISASSSLLLIVLFSLFKLMDSLGKPFSEKRGPRFFQNFLLSRELYGLVSPKTSFSFAKQSNTEIYLAIKTPSRFLVCSF